jgi:predicted phosphodiesterase
VSIKWEGKLEERRIELLSLRYSHIKIANKLSIEFELPITAKSIDNRLQTIKNSKKLNKIIDTQMYKTFNQNLNNEIKLFPEECYTVNPELCMTEEKLKELNRIYNMLTDLRPKKILSLSDLHAPFINFKAVEQAVLAHEDADICLLNGDVLDLQAMSKFDKIIEIDLDKELNQVFTLLDVLTKKFKYVVWVGGNHDMGRFTTYISKNFPPAMKSFALNRLNPISYISEKYDNLVIVPHDWIEVGDTIFAHLSNYSNIDMKTVTINNEIFNALRDKLPNPNYRAIVIGHTHMCGKIISNNLTLIEQGCLCIDADYRFSKPTKRKWQTGYAVVEFDENTKVISNKTNFYTL